MHINCDYGVQIIPDEILYESPAAEGFVNKNGIFTNKSKRKVFVYENEGRNPHCHYIDSESNREICVRLDKPEYFNHGGKQMKFTSDEKKTFIKFMKHKNSFNIETWKWCASTWNGFAQDNEDMELIKINKIPDYSLLETEA